MSNRKVADAIAETLAHHGVRFVFGIPGNDVLETMRACEERGMRYVLAKAEPSCAFMADAVHQLTGAPGVVIPALGPGISNMVSGIAGAMQERTALIALCGNVSRELAGIYNHQVFDQVALMTPVTKYAASLNPRRAAQQTAKALEIAGSYPAGPVFLDVPADVSRAPSAEPGVRPAQRAFGVADADDVELLARRLAASSRPLALVGRGALFGGAHTSTAAFLQACGIACMTSYKAKGVIDEHAPQCVGAVGLSPVVDKLNKELIDAADLLLLIGFDPIELRDAWLDMWPHDKAVFTLDWGPLNHGIFPLGREIYGDLGKTLDALAARVPRDAGCDLGWTREVASRVRQVAQPHDTPAGRISPAALFGSVSSQITPDWILTLDVGSHRILANHVLQCVAPHQLLQSNGLGCMGYSIPAAIGAQLVYPERPVVALLGDGCMLMTQGELAVIAERQLPIVVVVLNDASLSLIRLKQSKMDMLERGVTFWSPDFAKVGEAFGAVGVTVDSVDAFDQALRAAVASRRFTVINAMVDPSEYWDQM